MDRMTVFFTAENERGFVQAVISVDDWPHFDALGAAKTCDQVVKDEPQKPRRGRPRKESSED